MSQETWIPCWTRGSKITEMIWIGKDTLAWCTGLYIIFYNIRQRKQTLRYCANHDVGDGAHCISGHLTLPIFAYAEKCARPRIFVLAYPSLTKISECSQGCANGYLATAFATRDHVISLGQFPNFRLTVWKWRTGEKVIRVNTQIRDEVGQILRVSQTGLTLIAQMGRTCGRLLTWDLSVAGSTVILEDHEINLPGKVPILWIDWCPSSGDPLLAITDKEGHIFLSNSDGTSIQRIVLSQRCGICLDYELPMVSWFRGGIILRTTFCQIRFFKKDPSTNTWKREWYVKSLSKPCILITHPFKSDRFFYYTLEGYLMQIDFPEDQNKPSIERHLCYGASYRFADFVYPWCHHLIVTEDLKELVVLECYSGLEVSRIEPDLNGEITYQASHPDYPVIALTTVQGELVIVSFVDPLQPKVVAYLHLHRRPLDFIKFSYSGRYLIAAEKKTGICFCVNFDTKRKWTVQAQIETQKTITDIVFQESRGRSPLKVLILYAESKQSSIGCYFLLYDIKEDQNLIFEVKDTLTLPGTYRNICQIPGSPQFLIGSPYQTRQLRVQKIHDFKDITFIDGMSTGHQVKMATVFVDRTWITSSALDGLIFVRDKTVRTIIATFMAHHRYDLGTVKAMMNRAGNLIVCLGYDGSLITMKNSLVGRKESTNVATLAPEGTHRVDYGWYNKQKPRISSDYASLDPLMHAFLTASMQRIPGTEKDQTWSEWRQELHLKNEAKQCENEKSVILQDFNILAVKVKDLLNSNEVCPTLEKLPVSSFDLDTAGRDQKLKAGKDDREDVHQEFLHDCSEREKIFDWIKNRFWASQKVLGKSVFAVFGDKEVANYPLTEKDPLFEDYLKWAKFCRESMRTIVDGDTFEPWKRYSEEELREELNKRVKLHREDEKKRIGALLEEEEHEVEPEDPEEQTVINGTTTHRFIEQVPHYYTQAESYGFTHITLNNRFLLHDCQNLRLYFNRVFDEVFAMKEREMSMIHERIERIRYIDSELRNMFGQHVPHVPTDPEWHWRERPESIIKVYDHEISVKPYISPSQQEILDKQAAEAERIRQALLADDFRERALMAMMDGVLEVRWEDIIKIDVPKPACMVDKKPEEYTAEDIITVKQYEKDVQSLNEERERYKRILEADYVKVSGFLQEGIDKFNDKIDELCQLKIQVESAINQLNLRYVRGILRNYHRVKTLEGEETIKEKILKKHQRHSKLTEQLQSIRPIHEELLAQYESLSSREKPASRKFKIEFFSLGKLNFELLESQYKRRPKSSLKNLSANQLLDLGVHVLSQTQLLYLPQECADFLRALNHLDNRPSILPPSIETSHWEHFIRLRRQRIELELRIRAKETEIQDVENLIARFEEKIVKCKAGTEETKKMVETARNDRLMFEQDLEVQMVLKMGQVEINLRGDRDDTVNAIFIPIVEIDAVNRLIMQAGSCKLDALERMLEVQRGTVLKEWEHECLKKRLEDHEEDLHAIQTILVTKDMQNYLKLRAKGVKDDKTPRKLAQKIEMNKEYREKLLGQYEATLEDIQRKIAITKSKNELLDRQIVRLNVARCEMEHGRDLIGEKSQREDVERRMRMVAKRSDMIRKIQNNYAELLELQTEHELLRIRRYPMIQFKTIE